MCVWEMDVCVCECVCERVYGCICVLGRERDRELGGEG
jgi:hypothetical protein